MNIFELLKYGSKILEESGIEDYDFDALCLLEHAFDFNRNEYFFNRFEDADEKKKNLFISFIQRRKNGEPLQYILGKWSFMDGEFFVGDGVLIPRHDTEILVETVTEFIKNNPEVKNVVDLCSGSGCVGISIAMQFPDIFVTCIELSDIAFGFLEKNIMVNKVKNIKAIKGDITKGFEFFNIGKIDVLLSNPPYIETDEIKTLSREVQNEPIMALDGGSDGFDFYHIIGEKWLPYLNRGSFAAFECGETQAKKLSELYSDFSSQICIYKDLNGIERVVSLLKN